jgi:hypothetical protein
MFSAKDLYQYVTHKIQRKGTDKVRTILFTFQRVKMGGHWDLGLSEQPVKL